MAFYVDREGTVYTYHIFSPTEIKLSNGAVLQDPPPGQMFATKESAEKFSELLKETKSVEFALALHSKWARSPKRKED